MKRYVALLRGINVSGRNKIAMKDLRERLAELGFRNVSTCLNSGNAAFTCEETDTSELSKKITEMIRRCFALEIPVLTVEMDELEAILSAAPEWWDGGDQAIYDNLILMMPTLTEEEFKETMGAPKEGLERASFCTGAVFWSFSRKDYQKTNWWARTANTAVSDRITIRTAGTIRKIMAMK